MSSPEDARRILVVDASIVVKWLVEENDADLALFLLARSTASGIDVAAPSFMAYEVANALYQKHRRGLISIFEAQSSLAQLHRYFTGFRDVPQAQVRAIALAQAYGRPNVYDAHYLGLAEHLGAELWTADRTLCNVVARDLSWVHHLSEVEAEARQ
jgi:predicted nucleic acid-binding protein